MQTYIGDLPAYFALQNHDIYLEVIKPFNNVYNDIHKIRFVFGENRGVIQPDGKKIPNLKKILLKNNKIFYNAPWQCLAIYQKFGIVLDNVECIKSLSHLVFPLNLKTYWELNSFLNKEGLLLENGFENISLIRDAIYYQINHNLLQKQAKDMNKLVDLTIFLQCQGYSIENIINHGFKR